MREATFRDRRWRLGLAQSQLATLFGVDARTIRNWEKNVTSVPPMALLALECLEMRESISAGVDGMVQGQTSPPRSSQCRGIDCR